MKLKRVIAIACTAAMTASLISGCGGSSDEGQKEAVKEAEGTAKEDLPLSLIHIFISVQRIILTGLLNSGHLGKRWQDLVMSTQNW